MQRIFGVTEIVAVSDPAPHSVARWNLGDDFLWYDPDWDAHADGRIDVTVFRAFIDAFYVDDEGELWVEPGGSDDTGHNGWFLGRLPLRDLIRPDRTEAVGSARFLPCEGWEPSPVPEVWPGDERIGMDIHDFLGIP